jgi:hypothetical protein
VGGSFFIHYPPPSATLKIRNSVETAETVALVDAMATSALKLLFMN